MTTEKKPWELKTIFKKKMCILEQTAQLINVSRGCTINCDPLVYGRTQPTVQYDLFADTIVKALRVKILNTFLYL